MLRHRYLSVKCIWTRTNLASSPYGLRLCFASPLYEQIREGVAVLAEVCRKAFSVSERIANMEKRARS
jgi:DNA-binding transcriptional MocR family regulator